MPASSHTSRSSALALTGTDHSRARGYGYSLLLLAPGLAMVLALFAYPFALSVWSAFHTEAGLTLANFSKAWQLYSKDVLFSVAIISLSTLLIAVLAVTIAGYLTLGSNPRIRAVLAWLYRWPLFIPFIVAAQIMRTFLAKNGLMNNALMEAGLLDPLSVRSYLDWSGIVITFVWKQVPFVTLLLAGAMAGIDRSSSEAAQNLGASRLRILFDIVLPQSRRTLTVGLVLSVVGMLSVLSVPIMINAQTPTMLTVDMAYRINSSGDYGVANALGVMSYALAGFASWLYLRTMIREQQP